MKAKRREFLKNTAKFTLISGALANSLFAKVLNDEVGVCNDKISSRAVAKLLVKIIK